MRARVCVCVCVCVGLHVNFSLLLSEFNKKCQDATTFLDFPSVKSHENYFSSSETCNMQGNEQTVDEGNM
jgi:hypothetical protein